MSETDTEWIQRAFQVYGAGVALWAGIFLFNVARAFYAGRGYRGVIVGVWLKEGRESGVLDFLAQMLGYSRRRYTYTVAYDDPARGRRVAEVPRETAVREFDRGDPVTIYVRAGEPPTGEILKWDRTLFCFGVIVVVGMGLWVWYMIAVGRVKI